MRKFLLCTILTTSLMLMFVNAANAEETWHHKWIYLETIGGYNVHNGDVPIGLQFTYQQFRFGPYASVMYGFRNKEAYNDNYNPTRYGWYTSGGVSIRLVNEWSKVDSQLYLGAAWRVATTARDLKAWDHLSYEQKQAVNPKFIGYWGGELGVRFGGGRAGGKFAMWSGSVGVKMFAGDNGFELVPQAGLSVVLGGVVGIGGACTLLWL